MSARLICVRRLVSSILLSVCGTLLLANSLCGQTPAERPSSMKLFPQETLLYLRTSNAYEFGQRLRDSSTGRMLRDPQLQPFVEQLYGDAAELYSEKAEALMGVSWEDLQNLPHGEVAFAVVGRDVGKPAFLLLVDQGDEPSAADALLERALKFAADRGGEFSTEKIGDVEVTVVRAADDENRMFGVFERDNTIVVATDPNVLRRVLWHWDAGGSKDPQSAAEAARKAAERAAAEAEEAEEAEAAEDDADADDEDATEEIDAENAEEEFEPGMTLAENDRFTQILQQCRRPQDPPPHLVFFVDPIELVRNFGKDEGGVRFAMGLLPSLGLDGFSGIGGAYTAATDEYDDLAQLHVLLENPRSGVLQLPAFEEGDTTPQAFVPHAIENYFAFHWNMPVFYDRVTALVDQYRYEGSVAKLMEEKVSEPLGIDFETDILQNLGGRYTWLIGYDKPARFRGQQHLLAVEVKDEKAAAETLETIIKKFPELFEERKFGDVTYHAMVPEGLMEMEEEMRFANPFVAVMDGYFFIGGSCNQFERCVGARDGTIDRLVDSEDYARATEVLGRETAGTKPVMLAVGRFEETVRQWYDLLTSERTRELIEENKEGNPMLAALADAMDQHKLPPFEVLAPYLPPNGSILYDTSNGYHGIGFTLRNKVEP